MKIKCMGAAKRYLEEMEQRGYGSLPDKYVCAALFSQQTMEDYIAENGEMGCCSYSQRQAMVVPMDDVVKMVLETLRDYFEDPAEECGFESHDDPNDSWEGTGFHKEGAGYIVADNHPILDTREAMGFLGIESELEEVNTDIESCILQTAWILKDPYEDTPNEVMLTGWRKFTQQVIDDAHMGKAYDEITRDYQDQLTPIVEAVRENLAELSRTIRKGDLLYRCVKYPQPLACVHDYDLWAPPADKATSQRMSRQGQSRFYASFDQTTPLVEAVNCGQQEVKYLGKFQLMKDIKVLDLSHLFYPNAWDVYDFFAYQFLWYFAMAIGKPIEEDKTLYVPTQIMRDVFEQSLEPYGIRGIVYRSSKRVGKDNVVLFLDEYSCADYLQLERYEKQ